jgi:hypothetical protein
MERNPPTEKLRAQLEAQIARAQLVSSFHSRPVTVCFLKYKSGLRHISVIGNAISWGAVDVWRSRGTRVRRLVTFVYGKRA